MSISLLRRLLMKEAVKDTASSSGIMSINKNIADKVEQQVQRYVNDAMRQGVDLDTLSPEQLKMIVQINKPKPPRVIAGDSPEGRGIMEALLGKRGEVVDMAGKKLDTSQGIMGGKSVKELMDSGQVSKGARGMKKSKKVQDREMFQDANKRLKTDVNKIIADIKAMDPMDSMKEANSVIGRKGVYKNLTPEESKKILQDTEDHIFERNIPIDPEGFAKGGRISRGGGGTMGASDKGYQGGGRDKSGNVSGTAPGAAPGPGGNNNDGPKGPPSIINPPPKNNKPPETITFDDVTGKKMTAADRLAKQKFINFINFKKVYSSGENEEADDLYDAYRTASGLDDFQTNALVNSTANQLVNEIDGSTKTFYDRNATITDLDTGKSTKQLMVETPTSFTQRVVRPSGIMENDIPQPFGDPQSLSVDPMNMANGGVAGLLGERPGYAIGNRVDQEDLGLGNLVEEEDLGLGNLVEEDESDFSDIEGQTAFVGFPEIFALGTKVIGPMLKGGSASAILKNAAKEKLRQEIGKKIYKGIQKKITKPKYGTKGPTTTTRPGRRDRDVGGNQNVGGGNTATNALGQTASQATKAGTGTSQGYSQHFAEGGITRQNFAMGKRAFLKMIAGAGAGIAGLKSGLIGFGGKGAAKKAVTETVKSAGSGTPPPYFFRLVEKIKFMGDDALATQDKAIAKKYKDYTMEEDFAGNIEIIKKGDNVAEDVYISYKVDDVPLRGKKGSKRVEEYEEYTARPDAEGKMKDIEQGVPDEVIDEAGDTTAMTLKRSSGGIARMLGE